MTDKEVKKHARYFRLGNVIWEVKGDILEWQKWLDQLEEKAERRGARKMAELCKLNIPGHADNIDELLDMCFMEQNNEDKR